MTTRLHVELIAWRQVEALISTLASDIRASGYQPDIVIAIARGGYVPARLLCDHLNLFDLSSFRIAHYTGARVSERARLSIPNLLPLDGRKILLVDDVDDSGETFSLGITHLQHNGAAEIKTAALHHKQVSTFVPDYYAKKIEHWRWLTYPWALIEDLQSFIDTLEPTPLNPADAKQRLLQEYELDIPDNILQQTFQAIHSHATATSTAE